MKKFLRPTNVVEDDGTVTTLYANVVYTDMNFGDMLYRSEGPIEVRIDTEGYNNITIPELLKRCISSYNGEKTELDFVYGVLYIKSNEEEKSYIVALM